MAYAHVKSLLAYIEKTKDHLLKIKRVDNQILHL